ncbi:MULTISPECIES: radical SAM/SPASM protein FxsB, inactivated metallohydrolase extension form [unclassified Streptomyces]|uniref:radical SAM/SPASM protein FxsBH, inactivated beta-hydroxylase extension form n=1 Tax=unclassified Streptomyces TaxID=2593676 RepID=UPI001BEABDC4|nr:MULTISPECIES: radical SAM/SPASM protein FxsB, inactivated metallohydrolase extension form [unclassified Streptomyces]MBT2406433.1 FxsB family radical SAM/SPASM domain protein [Streptomyces sp. ISL-21]MBT2612756.1 FxsB family radical SAM/SPASM domain protein [Streptomyces sp. ISL-87]
MTGLIAFREIVLKVHSRCDLACDHCYVYEHADQSWRGRPKVISPEAITHTAARLAEHARDHALPSVTVILHGGEPLLAGTARLRLVCEEFTRALAGIADLDLRIHTNGLQLSTRHLDLFAEYGVRVGISLDGDRAANDRHRRFADGRTSHPLVLAAVALLRSEPYRHLYQGLLCTVDVANDPVAVLDALVELEPPRVDFLLPHATWEAPPPRPDGVPDAYARWLLRVFDHWEHLGRPVPVRLFESLLSTLGGGPSLTESLGLAPTDLVVVETDGALEQVDSLKSAFEGAAATGFNVFDHAFDQVAAHPGVRARQLGLAGVSDSCRRCPVVRSCGGGLYTHRYKADDDTGGGFDNPSVYCADLRELVEGVEGRTADRATAPELADPAGLARAQEDLTRVLLARLHEDLAGDADWARAWELLAAVEQAGEAGADALDAVLDHPFTRTWVWAALDASRERRADPAPEAACRLAALTAAAVLRGGLDLPAEVAYRDGEVYLPTLGLLRLGEPGTDGRAVLHATEDGYAVRDGRTEHRFGPAAGDSRWQPVRTWSPGPDAAPVALEDLDPYRNCFPRPPRLRLGAGETEEWRGRLDEAWTLLHTAVPEFARAAAAGLTTLTPLAGGPLAGGWGEAGRHGPGALGVPYDAGVRETALALLTGRRRARLRALTEVADLYALDGQWQHPSPWRERPVPVSRLLADVHERVAVEAYRRATAVPEPGGADRIHRALDRLSGAAELTTTGKRLVEQLRWELKGAGA